MIDKPPTHTTLNVLVKTKQAVQEIRKLKHMLDQDGIPRSTPIVMDEVVQFYVDNWRKVQQ